MTTQPLTITLPAELVAQAEAAGLAIEAQPAWVMRAIEAEIQRFKAGQELLQMIERLQALPDELKPTPDEIAAEIRAVQAELATQPSP